MATTQTTQKKMTTQELKKLEAKKAKLREYSARYRAKLKAEKEAAKTGGGQPAPTKVVRNGNGLAETIATVEERIRERAQVLMKQALSAADAGEADQAAILASFTDAAGHDPETAALIQELTLLRKAQALQVRIRNKDFGEPVVEKKSPAKKAPAKKRA